METQMTELKQCPFCGSTDTEIVAGIHMVGHVTCINCGASSGWWRDKNTAIKKWNTRYYPHEVQQAVDRMKPVVIKPKLLDEYHPDGSVYLIKCENCKQEYKLIGFEFSSEIQHCRKCGQAQLLDWDEDGRIDTALQKP